MNSPKNILNLGAGVQSSTVFLMACVGELPKFDVATGKPIIPIGDNVPTAPPLEIGEPPRDTRIIGQPPSGFDNMVAVASGQPVQVSVEKGGHPVRPMPFPIKIKHPEILRLLDLAARHKQWCITIQYVDDGVPLKGEDDHDGTPKIRTGTTYENFPLGDFGKAAIDAVTTIGKAEQQARSDAEKKNRQAEG